MKNIAFMTAVALLAIPAMAESSTVPATACEKACDKGKCPCCCKTSDKGVQCGSTEWLNVETVTLEAENGDPLAQYTVAWLSDTGNGMPQDSNKAADMYSKSLPGLQKAAEGGNACACLALAHMYSEGKGVEKDDATAKKYMDMYKACRKKAAESKDAPAPDKADKAS